MVKTEQSKDGRMQIRQELQVVVKSASDSAKELQQTQSIVVRGSNGEQQLHIPGESANIGKFSNKGASPNKGAPCFLRGPLTKKLTFWPHLSQKWSDFHSVKSL